MMALRHLQSRDFDGGAAVLGLHLAGLGARPVVVTALADDEESSQAELRLRAQGLCVRATKHCRSLVAKNRYVVDGTKLFKVDHGAAAPTDSRTEQWLAETILAAADGAAAVVFADFGYGVISPSLVDRVLPKLRKTVPILTADVSGPRGSLLHFRDVDLLCPTEREVRETLHDFTSGLGAVVWNLLDATAARQAIITLGKQGLVTFDRPETDEVQPANPTGRLRSEYLPALATTAVDPLGCGDALLATASLALAAGGSLPAAAYLGSIAAAIEARQIGNHALTCENIVRALNHRPVESIPARLSA
jgi:bifunctional ADP-heptose synthase (sugar kinase/adenylyltransferase)